MENRVFSNIERSDFSSAGYSESTYSYLNRSARPSAERLRQLIESWVSQYPVTERNEIIPRLQSLQDHELNSAFFELYLYQVLLKMGYEVEIHSSVSEETEKTPDFIVRNREEEFILEAVISHEQTQDEIRSENLLKPVLDKLNEIQSTDFFIHIDTEGMANSPIPGRDIRNEILHWLNDLNHDELAPLYFSEGLSKMPSKKFDFEGITVSITPIPKNLHRGQVERIIGSRMYGIREVYTKEAIRKSIKRKASRYGDMKKPYILAINIMSMSCDRNDEVDALFGSEQYYYDLNSQDIQPELSRKNDGSWSKKRGTRISGVLLVKSLKPWMVVYSNATLYLNPWAKYPYRGNLRKLPYAEVQSDGMVHWFGGIEPREMFGLPKNWPESLNDMPNI